MANGSLNNGCCASIMVPEVQGVMLADTIKHRMDEGLASHAQPRGSVQTSAGRGYRGERMYIGGWDWRVLLPPL